MALTAAARETAPGNAAALRTNPRWRGRFLVLAALYVILGLAGNAARAPLTESRLPPSAGAEGRRDAAARLTEQSVVGALFVPVRLFTCWSLFALTLYYTCGVWGKGRGFRYAYILAAEVYAEGAVFVGSAAAFAAAQVSGTPGIPWVPLGLDLAFPVSDFTARYVLNSINIFTAAYAAVLTTTISAISGIPRAKVCASVLIAWAGALMLNAGIVHALRAEFTFNL